MGDRLIGKRVLVTGAASGIGAACVERFAAEGAALAGIDLAPRPENSPAEVWREADVAQADSISTAVDEVVDGLAGLDVVVNAAGVLSVGDVETLEEAEWDRVIGVNLKGTWLVYKYGAPHMKAGASIVNLASIEGLIGFSGQTAYNVSKGGVVLLTRNMAADLGPRGIRVNCLCPGLIDTPMTEVLKDPAFSAIRNQFIEWHLLGRSGKPSEVAAAALFLASDDASFVHGEALVVDGGLTAGRRFAALDES